MRLNILKKHSTKSERRVYEVLKKLHIPFRHRWIIEGMEVDFIVDKYIIEIDGHTQEPTRNHRLAELGFTPLHLSNEATKDSKYLIELLRKL